MKRKVSILTLSVLFFASTTALPVTLHYCKMMQSASMKVCEMHKEVSIKTSCCEEPDESEIYFSAAYESCCSDKFIDASVKDQFVGAKSESFSKIQLPLFLLINSSSELKNSFPNYLFTDTSPPPLIDNHLYLTNSILLI
jgi:hypothetical protein